MIGRMAVAEKYGVFSSTDYMNTYTAAGLGVQCYSVDKPWYDEYQGLGIAQITDKQVETEYGLIINVGDVHRGSGVRCYIPIGSKDDGTCSVCKTHDEMINDYGQHYDAYYELEDTHNQIDVYWAQIYMRRRIQQVIDHCNNCTSTDKFIAAALGQNGSGFDWGSANEISSVGPKLPWRKEKDGVIKWDLYFDERIKKEGHKGWFDTRHQLDLFANIVWRLKGKNWAIPSDLKWNEIIWPLVNDTYSTK